MPTRRTRSACCAFDATGQAAAPPRIPRNSRRLMSAPTLGKASYALALIRWKGAWITAMSALGHKQTFAVQNGMSALPPKADMCGALALCPLCAKSGLMQCSKKVRHSITSSAICWRCTGTVRPRVLAVLRLSTNSNLVGCSTGRSAGFVPLSIFPAYTPACRLAAVRLGP